MPGSSARERRAKFATLQALRGLTAIAVVVCHLDFLFDVDGVALKIVSHLYLGVDIFFVISGFVIAMSTMEGAGASASTFLLRRIFRIVPLAWAVIALVTLLLHHPDASLVIRGLLLLPENPSHFVMPLVYPNWTLSYEMFFYLLFAAALLVSRRHRCEICLALIGALVLADQLLPTSNEAVRSFLNSGLFLEFGAGLLVARIIMHAPRGGARAVFIGLAMALIGAGLVLCVIRPMDSGFFNFGCGAAVIVTGLLLLETYVRITLPRWLHELGEWSYAIYVTQVFTVFALLPALKGSWLARHLVGPSQLICFLPATIAIAAILHYAVEKPGIRFGSYLAGRVRRPTGVFQAIELRHAAIGAQTEPMAV